MLSNFKEIPHLVRIIWIDAMNWNGDFVEVEGLCIWNITDGHRDDRHLEYAAWKKHLKYV